jgi:non-heme chloroperoxidase
MARISVVALLILIGISPARSLTGYPSSKEPRGMMESRLRLPNGIKIEYVEQGSRSGIPLILLHGLSDSWRSYELVLPQLPKSMHAFAISLRGHGDSDRPEQGYLPQDFASDVAAFMDAKKLERAVIIGHSMGSYVAQRFAIEYPDRTAGLVLLGSFDSVKGTVGVTDLGKELGSLKDPLDRACVKTFQESTCALPVPPEYMATLVDESMKVPVRVWRAALGGLADGDHASRLVKISAPTLIVMGEKDAFFPRPVQESLAAKIPNSRLLAYANLGHAIHWEDPARFAADLKAFIEQINEKSGRRTN